MTLDLILADIRVRPCDVGFAIIDVEGHQFAVLAGGWHGRCAGGAAASYAEVVAAHRLYKKKR